MVHRDHRQDDPSGGNQLEAARQALRSQSAAREHAERLLGESQNTIRDIQTKLAHERLAKDEEVRRAEADRQAVQRTLQTVQQELAVERQARQKSDEALKAALEACRIAEQRLRDATARTVRRPSIVPVEPQDAMQAAMIDDPPGREADIHSGQAEYARPMVRGLARKPGRVPTIADDGARVKEARRRGRPAAGDDHGSEIVEWWKPGWQKRFR